MHLFTTFILSLFLTIGLIPIFKRMAFRMDLVDEPDARKVHVLPMPRSGGISMAIGMILPVLFWVPMDNLVRAIHMGCAIIVVFGVVDDVKNLKYGQKLLAQFAAALVIMFYGGLRVESLGDLLPAGMQLPMVLSIVLTLLFIVGVTNAINLSDGLDGLAGGVSMLSFVTIGFFAYRCGNMSIALMSIAMAGAILGFLRYNTHPAVIFMGDAGSQMLGFLCVTFTLILTQTNTPYSQMTPLFLIGFPILDTLTVMVERIAKGGSPFKPDKNHFHHKLMKLGLFHSESVFLIYLLQAVFIIFAFVLRFYSNWINLGIFLGLASMIILFFEMARRKGFKFRDGKENSLNTKSVLAMVAGDQFSIKFFFRMLKWWLPLVLILQCVILERVPLYLSAGAGGCIILILVAAFSQPKTKKSILRIMFYCTMPFLMYESTINPANWMTGRLELANHATFIALILFVIATLNLTKRQKGFKFNPLDFLIFIVIIILPNLPNINIESTHIKALTARVLILFFSYDVLQGELREEDNFLLRCLAGVFICIATIGFI